MNGGVRVRRDADHDSRPPGLDAASFAAPAEFRPARWLDRETAAPHRPAASMPFGSGPRICPGRNLALAECRVVLATLFRSFEVERVGPAGVVAERFAFTMEPTGLLVRLTARQAVSDSFKTSPPARDIIGP